MPKPKIPKIPIFEALLFVGFHLLIRASIYWTRFFDWSTGLYIIFIIIYIWVFGVIVYFGLKYQKRTLSGVLAFKKVKFEISLGLIFISIGFVLFRLLLHTFIDYFSDYDEINFESYQNPILVIIDGAIIPGVFEEIMMKGVIYFSLRKKYSKIVAIIVASIIFAAAHLDPSPLRLISIFLFSLFTFLIYLLTKNLFFPIFVHIFNNLIAYFINYIPIGFYNIIYFIFVIISLVGVFLLYISIKNNKVENKN